MNDSVQTFRRLSRALAVSLAASPAGRIALASLLAVALGTPAATAQKVLATQSGGGAGAALGVAAAAGDADGDGVPDLAFGAPGHDGGRGRVIVLSGATKAVLREILGAAAGERFGASLDGAGDVDGDGHDDLVVGAPGANAVRIHSGADGSVLRSFGGQGEFGTAVAGAGDLDGDGLGDVLVGAPGENEETGKVYALSGGTGSTLGVMSGPAPGARFGSTLGLYPPDVLQGTDHEPDLIIGCTFEGSDRSGRVEVRDRDDLSLRLVFTGAAGEGFGLGARWAGDFDGDGLLDLVAGSDPRDASGAPSEAGTVRLYSGADGALISSHPGGEPGPLLGYGVGDVDGDGAHDLLLGEPLSSAGAPEAGRLVVRSGATGAAIHAVNGPTAGARFGADAAIAGDLNGDALMDFAVMAPGDDLNHAGAGSMSLLSLTVWSSIENGLPGVEGVPRLTGTGGVLAGQDGMLVLSSARPVAWASLILGHSLALDTKAGLLVATPDIVTSGLMTNSEGAIEYAFTWPEALVSGLTVYHQFIVEDPEALNGQSRSNTVAATVP